MGKARRKDVKEAEARLKRKEEQKKRKLISREVNLERASAKREQNRQILKVCFQISNDFLLYPHPSGGTKRRAILRWGTKQHEF